MALEARIGWLGQLRERGVLRVAASYAVIAWLLLQIADVTFEPLGAPKWAMPALIVTVALGFPVAILLAWFFELGDKGITRDAAAGNAPRPRVHGVRRYADVAVIGVLLATVAVLLVKQSDLGKPPLPDKPSLAVLPFANMSADPTQQYFSDGLAEEVLDRLGQVPGLLVVARSSSFAFRNKDADVRTIAERLGVTAVLEGAVRREGQRLRLSAKLVDAKTGYQLWSGSFDREVNDVFAVQGELAQAVIDAVVPVARGDTPPQSAAALPPTTSLGAYDLYLLGRAAQNARWDDQLRKSIDYFRQALAQDPKFARAQAALANSMVLLYANQYGTPEQAAVAEAETYKALAMDPKSSDAQVAYANYLRGMKRAGAEEAYRKAIELNPNNAEAWHGYNVWLGLNGREQESWEANRRARMIDPLAITPWLNYMGHVLRPGAKALRHELARASVIFADNPEGLRRFALATGPIGYPLDAWQFITASRKALAIAGSTYVPGPGPLWIWLWVDPQYSIQHGLQLLEARDDRDVPMLYGVLVMGYGLAGDEAAQRDMLTRYATAVPTDEKTRQAMRAFWTSVSGDYAAATDALRRAEPIGDDEEVFFGMTLRHNQALPAMLRTYRATGRAAAADALAARYLGKYRAEKPRKPDEQQYDWVGYAALAASEGRKDEAVDALRQAMRWADVPVGFVPQLPWFRTLEGYAPYDAIVREHAARVARIRQQMLALAASVGPGNR